MLGRGRAVRNSAGALTYSELGIIFRSGGEYVYPPRLGPEWGFMTGWVAFFAGFRRRLRRRRSLSPGTSAFLPGAQAEKRIHGGVGLLPCDSVGASGGVGH